MAAKLNPKPSIPPDRISADVVRDTVDVIREKRQVLSDAQMKHAGEYKAAEKKGMHNKALKLTVVMAKEEPAKRLAFWKHLTHYVQTLELDKDPQRQMFEDGDMMPSAAAVAEAVGVINNGVSMNDVPLPPHPAEFEGKKRLIGAWNKGVEARRDGIKKTDCMLTGQESIKVFEAGWEAMDVAVKAALDGTPAPAAAQGATIGGYQIPEGMTEATFTSLFKDGAALFRAGKSPGDHADAEDPIKARVLQLGWAAEQDEQQKSRDAAAAAEVLTPEEMQAIRAAGAAACRDGKVRSDCEHAEGSMKADLWLEGWEDQDNALFDGAADELTAAEGDGEEGESTEATDAVEDSGLALAEDDGANDGDAVAAAGGDDLDMPEPPPGDDHDDFPVGAMTGPTPAEIFAAE